MIKKTLLVAVMASLLLYLPLCTACGGDNAFEVGPSTPPSSPSDLNAEALSSSDILLTWIDKSDDEAGFKIERSLSASGGFTQIGAVGADEAKFEDSGLDPGTRYYYRVRAYNSAGNSGYSNTESATTDAAPSTLPSSPSKLNAEALSSSSIRLIWIDNSDNEDGFRIDRSLSASGPWTQVSTVGADVETFDDSWLSPGTRYYYRVRAYNSSGNSGYSNTDSATTDAAPSAPPFPPSNLDAEALSSSAVRLTWTDNSNNEVGFKIERRQTPSDPFIQVGTVGADVETFDDVGLDRGTTYYYRVAAYNSAGSDSYSNIDFATTDLTAPGAPSPPSNLSARVPGYPPNSVLLNWTDNSDNEEGFIIERSLSASGPFIDLGAVGPDLTSCVDTELAPSTAYYYRIKAFNSAGSSSYSNTASVTTEAAPSAPPSAPSNLDAEALSSSSIRLTWTGNSGNEEGFKIERSLSGSGPFTQVGTVGADVEIFDDSGLDPSTTYYYRVRAYNSAGDSGYSNTADATTHAAANTPALSGPSQATGPFILTWTFEWPWLAGSNDHYELEYSYESPTSGFEVLVSTAIGDRTSPFEQQINPDPIDIEETTYFRVRAHSQGSYTPYSNVVGVYVPELDLTFVPIYDNRVVKDTTDPNAENTVYQYGDLGVGTFYISGVPLTDYQSFLTALWFNIDSYIAGRTIRTAVLRLTPQVLPGDFGTTYAVNAIAGIWNPSTLTYNNLLAISWFSSPESVEDPPYTTAIPWEIDITAIVQAWANGDRPNYGIVIQDNNMDWPPYPAVRSFPIYSNDNAPLGAEPQLYIEIL